jgi:hypothetical protein
MIVVVVVKNPAAETHAPQSTPGCQPSRILDAER